MRALLRQTVTAMIVIAGSSGAAGLSAQVPILPPIDQPPRMIEELIAIQTFQQRVDEYVALHRLLEGPLPPLRPTRDMGEIGRLRQALAARLRDARPQAKRGDIIAPDVTRVFQRRIVAALSAEAWHAIFAEVEEEDLEAAPAPAVTLRVNNPWPENVPFGFVRPQLLATLPPLPPELRYCIIGRSLVLWYHHADLIVDFLPGAFASTT